MLGQVLALSETYNWPISDLKKLAWPIFNKSAEEIHTDKVGIYFCQFQGNIKVFLGRCCNWLRGAVFARFRMV
jgi:hypothetical protein